MKSYSFYCCPICGNVIASYSPVSITCCNEAMREMEVDENLKGIEIRNDGEEIIISIAHAMTKDDYISFIAFERWDNLHFRKLYPEWNEEISFPARKGKLIWGTNKGKINSIRF